MNIKTKSGTIKYYFEELLKDGNEHTMAEIKDYARKCSDNNLELDNSSFTVAVKSMIDREDSQYKVLRRGVYIRTTPIVKEQGIAQIKPFVNDDPSDVKNMYNIEIIKILDDAKEKIMALKGGIFCLSDEEFVKIRTVGKQVFDGIENIKAGLKD